MGERARGREVESRLITVEKNPGPTRDKTMEGRRRKMDRKQAKRKEMQKKRIVDKQNTIRIVTWNVQRMSVGTNNKRKLRMVVKYAEDNNYDVVLLSEIRADNEGVVWLGENENLVAVVHSEKAAVLLRGHLLKSWCDGGQIAEYKERCMTVKVGKFVFVAVYIPVWSGTNDIEIETVNEQIRVQVNGSTRDQIVVVGGDFNAHVGQGEDRQGVCGVFGLHQTNTQGRKLLEFCENNHLVHVNGFYNHRRRGTWCHPRSGRWYELDGFLMKNRHRHKHVKKISTIGEATISDHKPKLMKFQMDVDMRKKERVKRIPRIRFEKLRIEGIAEQYR